MQVLLKKNDGVLPLPDQGIKVLVAGTHADNIGLQWEPCHQMVSLIDPMPQIEGWGRKFFHVHGKDATIRWDPGS